MLSFFKRHIFLIIVIVAIVFMYLAAGLAIVFLRPTPGSEELTAYRLNLPNHIRVKNEKFVRIYDGYKSGHIEYRIWLSSGVMVAEKKKSPLRTLNCSQKKKDENCQNLTTRDGAQIQLTQNSESSSLTIRAIKHDTEFFLVVPQHLRQAHNNVNWQQVFTDMPATNAN